MRAYQLEGYEGPGALKLVELPEPATGDDEVLLDVHAIGINFPDLLMTQGLYQLKPELPIVPGCEIAGVVRSAPEGSGWAPGQRAAAFVWHGGYAEVATVPLRALMSVPDGTGLSAAAAMVVNYHTVLFGLDRRGNVKPGETVLVLGAGGGIGTAALQVAKGLGAGTIGGVANEEQLETARSAGADDALVLTKGFAAQIRQMTAGRGVDIVLDPLGDWLFDEALRALAPEGRILIVGFAAGDIPNIKVNRLLLRNAAAVGVAWGAFLDVDPLLMTSGGAKLSEMLRAGYVKPQIGARYRMEQIPDALEALRRGAIPGKGVVELDPTVTVEPPEKGIDTHARQDCGALGGEPGGSRARARPRAGCAARTPVQVLEFFRCAATDYVQLIGGHPRSQACSWRILRGDLMIDEIKAELQERLPAMLDADDAEVLSLSLLAGGASKEAWAVDASVAGETLELLVRRATGGAVFTDMLSIDKEYRVLQAAFDTHVKVPKPYGYFPDLGGREAFLMERVRGETIGRRIVRKPELTTARAALPGQMAEELARIHSIPLYHLEFVAGPSEPPATQSVLDSLEEQLDTLPEPHPAIELGLRWLRDNERTSDELVLVHADFRLGNFVIDEHGMVAVLDWELARRGEPAEDLGWALVRAWRFGADDRRLAGVGEVEPFLARYNELTGRNLSLDDLFYWEVAGNVRWAIGSARQAMRHLSGEERSVELAILGRLACEVEYEVLSLLREVS